MTTERRYQRALAALAALGIGLAGACTFGRPVPLVIYNASASAPLGFYRVHAREPLARGDWVLAWPPVVAAKLAAARGYLPAHVPLVKRVAALEGDAVCASAVGLAIGDRLVVQALPADRSGRPLEAWQGCRVLAAGEVLLLVPEVPDSFDGRYFGPVSRGQILGKLVPLWVG